jgi:hypothetical protein
MKARKRRRERALSTHLLRKAELDFESSRKTRNHASVTFTPMPTAGEKNVVERNSTQVQKIAPENRVDNTRIWHQTAWRDREHESDVVRGERNRVSCYPA